MDGAFVRLTKTKAKRVRLQPLVPSAVDLLVRMFNDAPKMVDGGREVPNEPQVFRALKWNIHREFNRIRDRAKLDDDSHVPFFRIKDLLSSAGTDAADEQFSEFNVASFLGHAGNLKGVSGNLNAPAGDRGSDRRERSVTQCHHGGRLRLARRLPVCLDLPRFAAFCLPWNPR